MVNLYLPCVTQESVRHPQVHPEEDSIPQRQTDGSLHDAGSGATQCVQADRQLPRLSRQQSQGETRDTANLPSKLVQIGPKWDKTGTF